MDQSEFDALVAMKDCSQTVEKKREEKCGDHSSGKKKENYWLLRRSIQDALNNAFFLHPSSLTSSFYLG